MKRFLTVAILLIIIAQVQVAQVLWKKKRYEAIASIGATQFFGDIGGFGKTKNILGFRDFTFRQTRFNINAGARYRILNNVSIRLGLTYGIFHATDARGSNVSRGYEAGTSFFEPDLIGEYNFIKSGKEESYLFNKGKGRKIKSGTLFSSLDFYAFAGIGGLSFKVKGNDKLVAEGMKSGGFTAVIPAGIGLKMVFRPQYDLGLELGGRYAFSDWVDGYSSQYSRSNDVYYFFNITFIYKILTGDNGLPAFLNKKRF